MDFSNYKFAATSLPNIMSNSKAVLSNTGANELVKIREKQLYGKELTKTQLKNLPRLLEQEKTMLEGGIILSVGCKKYLIDLYMNEIYGNRYVKLCPEPIGVPQMVRGVKTEASGVELLSKIDGKEYFSYKKQVENDYLVGELDVIDAPTPEKATKIFDIKSAKNAHSFFSKVDSPFTQANIWQMQAYFAITGIKEGEIVHCLLGEPEEVIIEQEELLFKKLCPDGVKTPKFEVEWAKAKDSLLYNDIPESCRLIGFQVSRDESAISLIYDTINACRKFLNKYHESHNRFANQRYFEKASNIKHNSEDMG